MTSLPFLGASRRSAGRASPSSSQRAVEGATTLPRLQNALVADRPHGCDQLGDPALSGLRGLRSLDGGHVLALETKRQAVEGRSRFGFVAQSFGEVRRLSDDPRCGIKLEIDHDDV